MNIQDLIDRLTEIRDEYGSDELEVRLAIQPRWAFAHKIDCVVAVDGEADEIAEIRETLHNLEGEDYQEALMEIARLQAEAEETPAVVYIGEGGQLEYLSSAAISRLGWER